jgi:hypothetical protein
MTAALILALWLAWSLAIYLTGRVYRWLVR